MPAITIKEAGVRKLLLGLNPSKASGPDLLPTTVLKHCAEELAPMLTNIFNQSLRTGEIPLDWLKANITPIFKKDDKQDAANYRPVSLTCVCCKVLEHIVYSQVMDHLDKFNILVHFQHGFRALHSCTTQLITTFHDLAKNADHKSSTHAIILDFSKAFDCVPHQRLLHKLEYYGIRNGTLQWVSNWLCYRSQTVVVDGQQSNPAKVESGVPQGTVLGPLLFLLFINDIGNNISSKLRLFADDALLYRSISSPEDTTLLQKDLTYLHEWSLIWNMKFNIKKCFFLPFIRPRTKTDATYHLGDSQLSRKTSNAYLGVELSENLSWSSHIANISKKANKSLGFIRRNLGNCSKEVRLRGYSTLVRPHLEYASAAWDPHQQQGIHSLESIQRRAIRFIHHDYNPFHSVDMMRNQLDLRSLQNRRKIDRLAHLYNAINNRLALPLHEATTLKTSRTRGHQQQFQIQHCSTNILKFSFFPRTILDWNQLPSEIITADSVTSFKAQLQKYFD